MYYIDVLGKMVHVALGYVVPVAQCLKCDGNCTKNNERNLGIVNSSTTKCTEKKRSNVSLHEMCESSVHLCTKVTWLLI